MSEPTQEELFAMMFKANEEAAAAMAARDEAYEEAVAQHPYVEPVVDPEAESP